MSFQGMKAGGRPRWSSKRGRPQVEQEACGLSGAAGPQPQEKEVIPQPPPNFIDIYLINTIIFKVKHGDLICVHSVKVPFINISLTPHIIVFFSF